MHFQLNQTLLVLLILDCESTRVVGNQYDRCECFQIIVISDKCIGMLEWQTRFNINFNINAIVCKVFKKQPIFNIHFQLKRKIIFL